MAETESKRAKIATVKREGDVLVWTFADGGEIRLDPAEFPENIRSRAMWHGFEQKGRDSYAGVGSLEDPLASAKGYLAGVIENLQKGDWSAKAGPGEGAEPPIERLAQAYFTAVSAAGANTTLDKCKAIIGAMDKKARAQVRRVPEIAAALAASAKNAPGLDDLLALAEKE